MGVDMIAVASTCVWIALGIVFYAWVRGTKPADLPDPPPTTVTSQESATYDPVKGYINLPPRQFAAFHLATQRGMTYRAEFDARVTMVGAQGLDSVDWPKHGPVVLTLYGEATQTVAAVLRDAEFQAEGEDWVWRSPTRRSLYAVGDGET